LHTLHLMTKLCPKQFGLFKITKKLSLVTYRLALLTTWKLHNASYMVVLTPYQKTPIYRINYLLLISELIKGELK